MSASRARGSMPPISARAACISTCRPASPRTSPPTPSTFPKFIDDLEELLTENRIFKQRTVDIGIVSAEDALDWCVLRPDAARLGRRLGSAQGAALRRVRPDGFRRAGRQERRLLRPLSRPHRGDAPELAHHRPVPARHARGADQDAGLQDLAAQARRDEALDGGADPPFQALHRGLPRAGGRDLHGGRGAEGRVRRLSRLRRHQQALPLQDPRAGLRLHAGAPISCPRATCWPTWWRSSARWTSCSARSTDDRARDLRVRRRERGARPRRSSPATPRGARPLP